LTLLQAFQEQDAARGDGHEQRAGIVKAGDLAIFGDHRQGQRQHDGGDLGRLVGPLSLRSLAVVPSDLIVEPLP
jgi:hypothetical protein